MDSAEVVKALHDVDPGFRALCTTLFGDAVDAGAAWGYLYGPDGVSKMGPDMADLSTPGAVPARKLPRGKLVPVAAATAAVGAGAAALIRKPSTPPAARTDITSIGKADVVDVIWAGKFSKRSDEKRQVFGWASVVEVGGVPVIDLQGDVIAPEDLETAAYTYVQKSRVGGDMHERAGREGEIPLRTGDMIESFVVTPEKIAKMGLPIDTPIGWWVGYQIHDDDAWDAVKRGERTGFSIHGKGRRLATTADEVLAGR